MLKFLPSHSLLAPSFVVHTHTYHSASSSELEFRKEHFLWPAAIFTYNNFTSVYTVKIFLTTHTTIIIIHIQTLFLFFPPSQTWKVNQEENVQPSISGGVCVKPWQRYKIMKINGETLLYYYNKEVNWMLETI